MPATDRLSPGAVALLREPQIAQLATLMADGAPQVTPVWVDVEPDGSHILVNTSLGRLKERNVARDPRVAVSVVDRGEPYRYVVVRGLVVARDEAGAEAHIHLMAQKYRGENRYPLRPGERRILLRIRPSHVLERGV